MMMCFNVYVCIWPGVMVSNRQDWISLKFIWHMTRTKHRYSSKREVTCQFGQEYLSLVHDVLALFMFFLMADLTDWALNYVTDRFCRGYLVSLIFKS